MKGSTVAIIIGIVVLVIVAIVVGVVLYNKNKNDSSKLGPLDEEELASLKEQGLTDEQISELEGEDMDISETAQQTKFTIKAARKLCRNLCKAQYPGVFAWVTANRSKCRKRCKKDALVKGIEYIKANY